VISNPIESLEKKLGQLSLFKGLKPAEISEVISKGRTRKIKTGAFFFYEGDPAEQFYVLTSGRVKLTQVTPEGQQVILRYISPGEEFAVIAVLSEISYPVSAEAVNDSTAMIWEKDIIQQLISRYPQIAMNALEILAGRIKEFQDRVREMATERVERRIARTLLRLVRQAGEKVPEGVLINLPLSRQDLAEMTGTTLFTVSRILSQWENKGIVSSGRERIVVKFPHGLVTIAEDLPPGHPALEIDEELG
jgi:CRP/FNR family transcriptional regulator, nitrogen oxide reductase regulator